MIGPAVIEEIQRLLAEDDLSQRKIAKVMKVSRGTVAAVAHGKRHPRDPRAKSQDEGPTGPARRCPGCGGMAATPCLACRIRELSPHLTNRYPDTTAHEPLRLELVGGDRARYEEIRRKRILTDD